MGYRLKWVDNNLAEDGYRIYRGEAPLDTEDLPAPLATLGPDTTQYDDTTALDGVEYFYRVSAFAGSQEAVSLEVSTTEAYGDPHWDKVVGLYRVLGETIVDLSSPGNAPLTNTGLGYSPLETPTGTPAMLLQPNRKAVFSMPALRTDDFTIEFFHRAETTSGNWPRVVSTRDQEANHSTSHNVQMGNTGAYGAWYGTQYIGSSAAGSATSGTFRHLAICRSQGQYRFYMDGILVSSQAGLVDDTNNTFVFGHGNGSLVNQWFSEVRITKGLARYTGDFTPPTEPFPNSGPFSPRGLAPALWLDAADSGSTTLVSGAVSTWQNKGNAVGDFSQATASARPLMVESALADLPVVRFDGTNDRLTSSATAIRSMFTNTGNGWAFAVFCRRGTNAKVAAILQSRTSGGAAGRFACYAGADVAGYHNSATLVARRLDSDPAQFIRSPVSYGTDWTMALFRADWATGELSIVVDGGAPTVGVLGTVGTTANTLSDYVVIGAEGTTTFADVDLAELTAGSGNHLTQSDTDKLFGYAAWKWGLVDKLPEDHPYKHLKPMQSPT